MKEIFDARPELRNVPVNSRNEVLITMLVLNT
jgi:hypothetical protein